MIQGEKEKKHKANKKIWNHIIDTVLSEFASPLAQTLFIDSMEYYDETDDLVLIRLPEETEEFRNLLGEYRDYFSYAIFKHIKKDYGVIFFFGESPMEYYKVGGKYYSTKDIINKTKLMIIEDYTLDKHLKEEFDPQILRVDGKKKEAIVRVNGQFTLNVPLVWKEKRWWPEEKFDSM